MIILQSDRDCGHEDAVEWGVNSRRLWLNPEEQPENGTA
jgi:hypothetical protein